MEPLIETTSEVTFRMMLRADLEQVALIEQLAFRRPWSADELRAAVADITTLSLVAVRLDDSSEVVGTAFAQNVGRVFEIHSLAVHPLLQRRGVGRALVEQLRRINERTRQPARRRAMRAVVADFNDDAIAFFQAMGFKAARVLAGHWQECDGYDFRWLPPKR